MLISTHQLVNDAINADIRHSVAAYLNGSHQYMSYTTVEIIADLLGVDEGNLIEQVDMGFKNALDEKFDKLF
jgi:hypothetical protein